MCKAAIGNELQPQLIKGLNNNKEKKNGGRQEDISKRTLPAFSEIKSGAAVLQDSINGDSGWRGRYFWQLLQTLGAVISLEMAAVTGD